jgi:hypothetical protein
MILSNSLIAVSLTTSLRILVGHQIQSMFSQVSMLVSEVPDEALDINVKLTAFRC